MPRVPYKQFAINIGENYPNFRREKGEDDFSFVRRFVAKMPEYRNWVDYTDESTLENPNPVNQSVKRTGNIFEDLKNAGPLPRTAFAPQRGRSGFEAPMPTQFTGFVGGELVAPQRPAEDIEFLPTTYSNTLEGKRILDFTKGKKDVESIRDYFTHIAQEGAVGSESQLAKTAALNNALDVNRKFAEETYNDLYPDATLSWSDFMAKSSDPQFQKDREILAQEFNSLFDEMKHYEVMGDVQSYNQAKQSAAEIANQYEALFGDFEQALQVASPLLEQVNQYGQELNRLNEEANKEAKDIEETNFFGKAALSFSRFGAGLGYVAADLFSALGATGIGDKMKSGLMDSQLSTKDPRMAAFKAPYDSKKGGFTGGAGNAVGFIFEQGLNMIPAIVAFATPYGRAAQMALATIGTTAITYDEYANEIDRAAIETGAKIDPQTRAALAGMASLKTGLIENVIPINKFVKLGMAKSFADDAVRALASGKSLEVAMRGAYQASKAFAAAQGVEISEEIVDQLAQETINQSVRSQMAGLEQSEQFAARPAELSDYKDIVVNTAIAVTPLAGVGFISNGARFKEDLYHHVGRKGDLDAVMDLFEENKDKFKAESYKKNTDRLKKVSSVYESIPQEFDDVNARKVADNMLEIDRLDGQLNSRTSSSQREAIENKIAKLQGEIDQIYKEEQGKVATEWTPQVATEWVDTGFEAQMPESDQNVLNVISERIEPILNPLTQRMTNAEEIDMAEIEAVSEKMIDEQTRVLESENLSEEEKQSLSQLIELQIDNLLNYEFATTTTTEQTGQAVQVKGVVRTAKPGLPQKVSTDRFFGTPVTNPQTGEKGFLVLTKVPITQSRTGLKYQFVSEAEMKRQKNGEYKAQQGILKLGDDVAPSTPFTNMEYVSSNFGEDGNLTSVVLRDAQSGNELQIDDQELALDIAIAESQKQIGTVPEGAFISTIQRVIPVEQRVKIFPNLRETGTTPAAVGVQPQTEQDVRQETNAAQEGRAQGENAAPVPQEEGRQEGQVAPTAVVQEGETPPATKPAKPKTTIPAIEDKEAKYKREDFPDSQVNTRTPVTQKLLDFFAETLGISKFTEDLSKGTYISWLQNADPIGYAVAERLNTPKQAFDIIAKHNAELVALETTQPAPPPTEQKAPTTEEAIKGMAKSAKSAESLAKELEKAQRGVRKRVEEDQEGAPAISESEFERISKKLNKAFKGNVKIVDAETFQKEAKKTTGESIELKSKDGTVYGSVLPNGVMFIDRGKLSANTLLHEHTHLFNQVVMNANPKLWSAIKEAVKQTDEWGKVKNSKAYSNLTTDDQIADEVFSRIVGNAAENGWQKYTNKPIYKKIKDLAQKFYNTILEAFGANVYEGMSAGALADLTLNELLGGISTTPYQIDVKINDLMSQLFKGTKYFNQVRFSLDLNSREKFKNALGERDGRALYDIFGNVQDVQKVVQFAKDKFPIKGSLAAMSKLRTENNGTFGSAVVYSEFQKLLDNELKSSINQAKLDPSDLLKKVGYTLFNPTNLKDARDSFLHYYKENKHICTLNPYSTRFKDYFVTFIIKDDAAITPMADELTQDNLTEEWKIYLEENGRKNPNGTYNLRGLDRSFGDPYSKSVVSLQINKSNGSVKEISRYNHQVPGSPDNIFGKDFDRIVENLGDAMFQKFGVDQNASQIKTDLPDGVVQDAEGRFFNYIYEKNGTYYGEGFYTTNGVTTRLDPNKERMVDGYVINANGKVENIVAYDIDDFFYGSVQKVNYIKGNEISITTKNGDFVFETKNGAVSRLIEFPEQWMHKILNGYELMPLYDSNGNIVLRGHVGEEVENREKINMWWSDKIISVNKINLVGSKMQSLGKLKYVMRTLRLGEKIESLGDVVYIGGGLEIDNNEKIRSLGKVKYIGNHLIITFSPNLTDLGGLEYVGGSLHMNGSAIGSLGKLKYVGNNLMAFNSSLEDLGDLIYVGGSVELDRTRIRSLGKLKYIGGEGVGNTLSLEGTEVESLGNVEYIAGSIDLRNISDLGNLRFIGGFAFFNGSRVKSAGKLQYVNNAIYGDAKEILKSEIDAINRAYNDKLPFNTKKITTTIKTFNRGDVSYSEEDKEVPFFKAIPFEVDDLDDRLRRYGQQDRSSIEDIFNENIEVEVNKFLSNVDQIISQNTIKEKDNDLSEKKQSQPERPTAGSIKDELRVFPVPPSQQGRLAQYRAEGRFTQYRSERIKSAAQKAAKSFNNWATGGGNKLGIANLPEQDAERFAQLIKDIGVLAEALVENGMTRAETALRAIKPYFETNYSEWLRLANVYFKSEFNLALIQKYPEVYKRGQKLQKEFDKTLKQRDALLAKDIEEAKAEIIGKIKSRLNPSNWATKTKAKLAKARLTSESISDLKAYSKLFTDEDLSEMDPKMLKELYKEIDQVYRSGRRSQIANNKILNEQAKNLRQRSVISVAESLGLTESVSSYEIAKKKAQRPGVRFYIMLNSDPNVIQEVGKKDIDSWKDFFGAKGFTTIAIDVNANTSSKQKGLLGKLRSGINMIAINNFFDTRNIMALLANDEDSFNMFEKNFIDLIYKSDFERDELKNTIGRFDSIAQKLKKEGYDISKKEKSIVLRLGDNNAEGTSSDGLTIGQIIDVFMMLRDPDALVRSGGGGLVNYNQDDIDKIIDYVLSNKPVLDAVEEVTAKYQDVLQEHILPTLSTFGYDLEKFNTRTYNTNGSFSKNDVENARAIEILNKVYSNNIPQSVPYSPLSVFSGEEMIGKDYDVTNPGNEEKVVSVLSNNVISRIGGGQLQFGNVANKYNNYMNGMIDMVTRMPVLHNAQAIFNKDVSRLIENKLGESATKAIKNNINRVVSNRLKVSEEESMINPAMSNWLNRAVLGQMFLNTRSAIFQPIALLNYAAVAPDLEEYAKSTARMLSPINFAETAKEISNQAWVKERFGGKIFSIDAKELDERTKNDQPSYWTVIDQLLKAGYTLTAAGDMASILVGGSPLYDSVKNKKYNEYIKTMSEKDAEAQSIKDASLALYKATNESQQSSNNLLISNSQKNPAIRFFLSFTTANQQLLRRALLAGQMMKLGVGSPQRNAYTILQFGMINAALFTLISRTPELLFGLFDDDEEDLKKKERKDALKNKYVDDVIGGLMSGLGAPGVLLYNSIRGLMPDAVGEEKFDKVTNPEMFYMFSNNLSKSISSSAPAFSIKLRQIEDAIKAAEKGEYVKSLANAISFGSGIPTARAYDLFGQAAEASVRDYTGMERVLRATDIYNKGWAQKHYEEQVLRGKTPALSKIEEKEIKDKNTRELNELMRDLGFRAASKNEAGLKADLEKVKKYSEYAAKNYSLTSDQYETLVENFNRGYFAGTLPKEFVDYGRMSSQTRVEAIAKKINSFENDLERQEYLLKLDSANANQTLFSAGEVKRIKELIE